MIESLLQKIRRGTVTSRWSNNKTGQFEYLPERICYRFVATTEYPYCWVVREQDRNDENSPIVINGFLAFLIACWGQDEVAIYTTFNERKKKAFFAIETRRPGSFKRNLEKELSQQLLDTEQYNIAEFKNNFDYIFAEEKSLLLDYAQNYLEYTASIYKQKMGHIKKQETFITLLLHEKKDQLIKLLHELLDDKDGKDVVIVIKALEILHLLKPYNSISNLHRILTDEFEDIGTLRNFTNYMNGTSGCNIQDTDIEKYVVIIKNI